MVRALLRLFGIMVLLTGGVLIVSRAEEPLYECAAFAYYRSPIYRLCPRDDVPHIIGDEFGEYGNLALSPDGKWLVFNSFSDSDVKLLKMRVDGSDTRPLIDFPLLVIDSDPQWSLDGGWIAFIASPGSLYLVRPDGNEFHAVDSDPVLGWKDIGQVSQPIWSPDSQWIALAALGPDNNYDIFRIRPDGTGLQRLTTSSTTDLSPTWSPDGKRIAYVSYLGPNASDIHVMDADGTEIDPLVKDVLSGSGFSAQRKEYPSWSSDGQWILFMSYSSLYRTAPTRNSVQRILEGRSLLFQEISRSPDGEKLLFATRRTGASGALYIARSDGNEIHRLESIPYHPSGYAHDFTLLPLPVGPWRGGIPLTLGGLTIALSFFRRREGGEQLITRISRRSGIIGRCAGDHAGR